MNVKLNTLTVLIYEREGEYIGPSHL